jgi:hypothetical protein
MVNANGMEEESSGTYSDVSSENRSLNISVQYTKQTIDETLSSYSWFAVLWTCQREIQLKNSQSEQCQSNNHLNHNIQFWVLYKFNFDNKRKCKYSDLGIVGLLSYKMEKESFWLTPTAFECENHLQGQLFDEIYDENMFKLSDMQEKAIKFMQDENQASSSNDFQFMVKNQSLFPPQQFL